MSNGSTQSSYIERDKAVTPTLFTEALMTTSEIKSKQKIDVVALDLPNMFVQTQIPESKKRLQWE